MNVKSSRTIIATIESGYYNNNNNINKKLGTDWLLSFRYLLSI